MFASKEISSSSKAAAFAYQRVARGFSVPVYRLRIFGTRTVGMQSNVDPYINLAARFVSIG